MTAALAVVPDEAVEEARAWFGEFFADLDTGCIRLAESGPDGWREYERGVPIERLDALAEAVVKESETVDLYACPYAHDGPRRKGQAVSRRHVHADIDGPLDLSRVNCVGGMALASGSVSASGEPHGHVYVRLDREVTPEVHTALCARLGAFVGGEHHDTSKVLDNDVLRPAGTRNHKGGRAAEVRWLIAPDETGVKTWEPEALAHMLGLSWPIEEEVEPTVEVERVTGSIARRLDGLAASVTDAPRGEGNDRLNKNAYLAAALCASDPDAAEQVRAALVAAYMARPVPSGENVTTREREARRTVDSGWEAGTKNRGKALAEDHHHHSEETMNAPTCSQHPDYPSRACLTCEQRHLWVRDEARRLHAEDTSLLPPVADLLQNGSVVLDAPTEPTSIWGAGSSSLQAEGEALMLVGPSGVGKTTLAQQYALRRMGARDSDLLGLPVQQGAGRVLYLAMDRPQQAVRSLRRMVTEEDRQVLEERLTIWSGPPPVDLTVHRDALAEMCLKAGADTVIVDSLKDVGGTIVDDEGGTGWNSARQRALVAGVQMLELHHNRKGEMAGLADVYGSAWLTNGAGSVLAVKGSPGDPIVRLQHLKQPADEVGPLQVTHNHVAGSSTVWDEGDVVAMAADSGPSGITAKEAARGLAERPEVEPGRTSVEKARRRLNRAVDEGRLRKVEGEQAKGLPDRWVAS